MSTSASALHGKNENIEKSIRFCSVRKEREGRVRLLPLPPLRSTLLGFSLCTGPCLVWTGFWILEFKQNFLAIGFVLYYAVVLLGSYFLLKPIYK